MTDPDDVTRGLLFTATGRQEVTHETLPLGAAISTLDAREAAQFAQYCADYAAMKIAR